MITRYSKRIKRINDHENYDEWFKERNVSSIYQYLTGKMSYPTEEQMKSINYVAYVWKAGDMFYKLSDIYYDDAKYWWIIAWFNQKPTEAHVQVGDTIFIPLDREQMMKLMGV